jgi:hypothetical protein
MNHERLLWSVGLAIVLVGIALAGCGGSDDSSAANNGERTSEDLDGSAQNEREVESSQAYRTVLVNLKKAAHANATYDPLQRAKPLEPGEEAVVIAFCETAWQLVANSETDYLSKDWFIVPRIRGRAEFQLDGRAPATMTAAMTELEKVVDLAAYDKAENSLYEKVCYP